MEFFADDGKHLHEDCSTLILPALSIGNVGQLAIDLLISATRAERIGFLDDPDVLPCIGNDAYWPIPQGDLVLPLEAYDAPANGLTLVQQRSPVIKGMMIEFAKNIAKFAAANGKKQVVVLSGLDFGRWQKVDMSSGLQIHYLSSASMDGSDGNCEKFGWKRLQEYNPAETQWKHLSALVEGNATLDDSLPFEDELGEEEYYASLPFAALFSCLKAKGLSVTCLLCYCSEGDNTSDAFHLAKAASKFVGLNLSSIHGNEGGKWVVPFSWNTVYGPPPDMSMF